MINEAKSAWKGTNVYASDCVAIILLKNEISMLTLYFSFPFFIKMSLKLYYFFVFFHNNRCFFSMSACQGTDGYAFNCVAIILMKNEISVLNSIYFFPFFIRMSLKLY